MATPEEAGIDTNNLEKYILLFDEALKLSKNNESEETKDYQFILTTGLEKCPKEYEEYVKLDFSKKEGRFILEKIQK